MKRPLPQKLQLQLSTPDGHFKNEDCFEGWLGYNFSPNSPSKNSSDASMDSSGMEKTGLWLLGITVTPTNKTELRIKTNSAHSVQW